MRRTTHRLWQRIGRRGCFLLFQCAAEH